MKKIVFILLILFVGIGFVFGQQTLKLYDGVLYVSDLEQFVYKTDIESGQSLFECWKDSIGATNWSHLISQRGDSIICFNMQENAGENCMYVKSIFIFSRDTRINLYFSLGREILIDEFLKRINSSYITLQKYGPIYIPQYPGEYWIYEVLDSYFYRGI